MTNITKFEGNIERLVKQDKIMVALNQEPPKEWVEEHPFIKVEEIVNGVKTKVPYKYIPIARVEWLLRTFFKNQYKIEIIGYGTTLNAVSVHVRVHFKEIGGEDWLFHDGIGGIEVQTAQGTGSLKLDLSNINRGAVMMALPNAKSIAIKDACDHFGKLFGSDLNRKQQMTYAEDTKLQPIDIGSDLFAKMKEAVKSGAYTIEQIEKKYTLTNEAKEALNETI